MGLAGGKLAIKVNRRMHMASGSIIVRFWSSASRTPWSSASPLSSAPHDSYGQLFVSWHKPALHWRHTPLVCGVREISFPSIGCRLVFLAATAGRPWGNLENAMGAIFDDVRNRR